MSHNSSIVLHDSPGNDTISNSHLNIADTLQSQVDPPTTIMIAQDFPRFQELVTEVRLIIWEQALFIARPPQHIVIPRGYSDYSARLPALAYVNREAREVALTHLKQYSVVTDRYTEAAGYFPKRCVFFAYQEYDIFCCFDWDRGGGPRNHGDMYMEAREARSLFIDFCLSAEDQQGKVKHVAVSDDLFDVQFEACRLAVYQCAQLKLLYERLFTEGAIETFTLVHHHDVGLMKRVVGFELAELEIPKYKPILEKDNENWGGVWKEAVSVPEFEDARSYL